MTHAVLMDDPHRPRIHQSPVHLRFHPKHRPATDFRLGGMKSMNYPQAIVAAAGILAGAIVLNQLGQTAPVPPLPGRAAGIRLRPLRARGWPTPGGSTSRRAIFTGASRRGGCTGPSAGPRGLSSTAIRNRMNPAAPTETAQACRPGRSGRRGGADARGGCVSL